MKRFLLPASIFLLALTACNNSTSIEDISWILGKWKGIDDNGAGFHEQWRKESETTYVGAGCAIDTETGDTLFKETLKIETIEGVPYYVATVPENPGPVLFRLVKGDETNAVFENKDHDFPQRIAYTLETKNTMSVKLEGVEKGTPKMETLRFERANDEILDKTPQQAPVQDTTVTIQMR